MPINTHIRAALVAFAFAALAQPAAAEMYAGGFLGYSFDNQISSVKGDENTNYPDAPDPLAAPLLPGSHISDLNLDNSGVIGVKAGYFFQQAPFFGVEAEFSYSQPQFKRQLVTLTQPGYTFLTPDGAGSVTEDQLAADADKFTLSLNAILRYQGFKKITPYVGAGPTLNIFRINGTGYSGIIPAYGAPGGPGPKIDETTTELGWNVKAGAEYALGNSWSVGVEYRYEQASISLDHFRSISNADGDFSGSSVDFTLVKHF